MPTGYAGMFVLSWFPPLFAAIMDPLVERAYRQREEMERLGVAASSFPSGSNNISSFFKKEGKLNVFIFCMSFPPKKGKELTMSCFFSLPCTT